MQFQELKLHKDLIEQCLKIGYKETTTIQDLSIPRILSGADIIGIAQTGSGKTAAYILPILDKLNLSLSLPIDITETKNSNIALILVPTRELALQVYNNILELNPFKALRTVAIYGGIEYQKQEKQIKDGYNILVATPGRLLDLIERQIISLDKVSILIIDEVDQMFDLGFRDPVAEIDRLTKNRNQIACFSATYPIEVEEFTKSVSNNPRIVKYAPEAITITQSLYYTERAMMQQLLFHLIRSERPVQGIIFTRSRKYADRIADALNSNGIPAESFHSDRSQAAREYIMQRFRDKQTHILVATDVMARGIDVPTISHVFNYGLPQIPETYLHRIGRTGRAGRQGIAITICEVSEQPTLLEIQRLIKKQIPVVSRHPYHSQGVTKELLELKDKTKK